MVDEKKPEKDKPEEPTADSDEGNEPKESETAKLLDAQNERIAKLEADAEVAKRGGETEAGAKPEEKKPLTPEEVADMVAKGEMNPLAEDGYI